MASHSVTTDGPLPFAGYIRVSRVNGRAGEAFVSPAAQRESIEKTARAQGLTLAEVVEELDVSGGKTTEERELGRLVQAVKDGEYGGIIVWNVKRYSRAWLDGLTIFDSLLHAGGRLVAEDFSFEGLFARSVLSFLLEGAEEERRQKSETWDRVVSGTIERGIHSGSTPPRGYEWPKNEAGKKCGPLEVVAAEAKGIRRAFAEFGSEEGCSWSRVMKLTGAKSTGAARNILTNPVYTGQARAGKHVKDGAHEALVDEQTFERVQRRLKEGEQDVALTTRRPKTAKALTKVLRCSDCGSVLSPDLTHWRCKRYGCLSYGAGIATKVVLPWLLAQAQAAHSLMHLGFEVDQATLAVFEDAVRDARRKAIEAAAGIGLSVEDLPEHTPAVQALRDAEGALRAHEASRGWIARSPEQVAEALAGGDPETLNSFLIQTVRVFVTKCGRHALAVNRTAEARCRILVLDGSQSAEDMFPLPTGGKKKDTPVKTSGAPLPGPVETPYALPEAEVIPFPVQS